MSFIAKLFDPMGFIGPYIMMAKILFQELWVLGLDWDCEVPAEANKQFCSWLLGFEVLKQFRIPRPYFDLPWKYVSSNDISMFLVMPPRKPMERLHTFLFSQKEHGRVTLLFPNLR